MSGKPKDKKRRSKIDPPTVPMKGKRPKPGSRAVKEVRHYQLSAGYLIPRKTFERRVRAILLEYTDDPKLDQGAKDTLQWDLENVIEAVMRRARDRAETLNLKTCTPKHLEAIVKDDMYIGSFVPACTEGI